MDGGLARVDGGLARVERGWQGSMGAGQMWLARFLEAARHYSKVERTRQRIFGEGSAEYMPIISKAPVLKHYKAAAADVLRRVVGGARQQLLLPSLSVQAWCMRARTLVSTVRVVTSFCVLTSESTARIRGLVL